MNLPKATTHRLCQQLEQNGYVVREPGGRRFTPGARLLRVGFNVLRSGLTAERHQVLTALVDAIGETCYRSFILTIGVRNQAPCYEQNDGRI